MAYHSIRPGRAWLDTSGKPIQAHGFSVFYNEQEKLWYWYGENNGKGNIWHYLTLCLAADCVAGR